MFSFLSCAVFIAASLFPSLRCLINNFAGYELLGVHPANFAFVDSRRYHKCLSLIHEKSQVVNCGIRFEFYILNYPLNIPYRSVTLGFPASLFARNTIIVALVRLFSLTERVAQRIESIIIPRYSLPAAISSFNSTEYTLTYVHTLRIWNGQFFFFRANNRHIS